MDEDAKNGGPNFLRAWRMFRGLTQAQLAEAVDTNANMIQYLETGERGLSAKWLRKLAPALKTQPGYLLDFDPHDLDSDLVDIWVNASVDERKRLVAVAKAVVTGTNG